MGLRSEGGDVGQDGTMDATERHLAKIQGANKNGSFCKYQRCVVERAA